tara:strand:+ start:3440 stop:4774 length:1335 start_codon:yes stop_codon:yes gene_type:complete
LATGTYKGETVELDTPIETPDEQTKYKVYALNSAGDVVRVRFNGEPAKIQSDDKSTPSYWNNKLSGSAFTDFKHRVFFDATTKRIRSVRDGVQEYFGVELGIEPASKAFSVYRAPETISAIAGVMDNLPIIGEHIDPELTPTAEQTIGVLKSTEIIEFNDDDTFSTLYLENEAAVSGDVLSLKDSGKKEFSLGYLGKLREHETYDFEQYDLRPTHLALVDSARGGSVLTFIDKKEKTMLTNKAFKDKDGAPSMQQIVDISKEIPEAIKTLPADKAAEVMALLKEMIEVSDPKEEEMTDEQKDSAKKEMMDEDYEDMDEDKKEVFEDSKLFKTIVGAHKKSFADDQAFKDAVVTASDEAVKAHSVVVEKATQFVDDQYSFADKSTKQVMLDALAVEHGDTKFEDAELTVAFKLLKKSVSSLEKFGDSKDGTSALETRIQSDLEGE